MKTIVQKYGGATLADPTLVKAAAARILEQSRKGPLIVVVSAMGTTTNSLIDLARQVSARPARRELDMLLSVGERISMSLMSMALQDLGASAISFTGSQAGILTDEDHFNAKIIDVKSHRVAEALAAGKIVILAGFQGVSPISKEITTLGRGGSDVTAVAMAAAFQAQRCEILKEVSAVYTADPRAVSEARSISQLGYDELLEMTFWGAKVLHHRSVELARRRSVELYIGPAANQEAHGTLVGKGHHVFENQRPLSLNSHECVLQIEVSGANEAASLNGFHQALSKKEIASPQILSWNFQNSKATAWITGPKEILTAIREAFTDGKEAKILNPALCSVTMTCAGSVAPELSAKVIETLEKNGVKAQELRLSPLSVTVFMNEADRQKALTALHNLIPK